MSDQEVTTHQKHETSQKRPRLSAQNPAIITACLVAVCGLSFYAGMSFQKSAQKTSTPIRTPNNMGNQFGGASGYGRFSGQRPVRGHVTAVSSTSITVQDDFSGGSSTYAITSSTTITNNGQTASVSDIKSGDTVAIVTSTSNSQDAARIMINPVFGGRGFGGQGSSTTNSAPMSTQ